MKQLPCLAASTLLACCGAGVAEAGPHCETFAGTLTLTPLDNCTAFQQIKRVERIFEDAVFLFEIPVPPGPPAHPPYCFDGVIPHATLTDAYGHVRNVKARSLSALTANAFTAGPSLVPPPDPPTTFLASRGAQVFTAASVVTISSNDGKKEKELGSIFLRDTGVLFAGPPLPLPPPYAYAFEQLIGVGGTKEFARASVSLTIEGYEIVPPGYPPAAVVGTVCW